MAQLKALTKQKRTNAIRPYFDRFHRRTSWTAGMVCFVWTIWSFSLGCGGTNSLAPDTLISPTDPNTLVETTLLESRARDVIDVQLDTVGLSLTALYDVDIYKVSYRTKSWDGIDVIASGALALPVMGSRNESLPLLSYQHGTVVNKQDVPSVGGIEQSVGVGFASLGYAVAMPDYLGLGDSQGMHPFVHASSEATATIDSLRALR